MRLVPAIARGENSSIRSERSRTWALDFLADRLWGKPAATIELLGAGDVRPPLDDAQFTEAELSLLARLDDPSRLRPSAPSHELVASPTSGNLDEDTAPSGGSGQRVADHLPNAACTTALIDRVVHHAEIIAIEGDSSRRREAEAAKASRRSKAKA